VLALTALVTARTFRVQPQVLGNFSRSPWGLLFPLVAVAGLAGVLFELRKRNEPGAFLASCAYLTGMLASVVFGLYPLVLPARNARYSLTVNNAAAGRYGLKIALVWWVLGVLLAAGYFTFVYRSFAGKVAVDKDSQGYGD
jgi:cytochrome d ubiquinol oxidase subunit II